MTDISAAGRFTFPGADITVNRMGYGAMQLAGQGAFGPPKDRDMAIAVLQAAVRAGVDHIDTSDFYGPHVTNQIIREALYPYPDGLTIVTKIGFTRGADGSWDPAFSAGDLRKAVEDNLSNLGLSRMEIVNLRLGGPHGPEDGSIAERLESVVALQQEGIVRHIGLSNVTMDQVDEARAIAPIVCVQNQYNLAQRRDDAMIDALAQDGIAYVPFFPMGGFTPLQSDRLTRVAEGLGATDRQVAIAWLLQRAPNVLLIPGTSSVEHLHENLAAAELTLPADALDEFNRIGA